MNYKELVALRRDLRINTKLCGTHIQLYGKYYWLCLYTPETLHTLKSYLEKTYVDYECIVDISKNSEYQLETIKLVVVK